MAYIQKRGERKYKITVCNGYRSDGKKRQQARTIDVPVTVPKRGIMQYVHAEADRLERKFRTGVDVDDRITFEAYATGWLERQNYYKESTLAGYSHQLKKMYPYIGGIPLCKMKPLVLEEMCEQLRKLPNHKGGTICEATVNKYLNTVSAVLEDAKKNDIILYNPAHRVRRHREEFKRTYIPQSGEMFFLLKAILREPLLYRAYFLTAMTTGLRRGELCALRWGDIGLDASCQNYQLIIHASRSSVIGKGIVESDTKNHRTREVSLPSSVYNCLVLWRNEQTKGGKDFSCKDYIFSIDKTPIHPDTFSRRLRKLCKKNHLSPKIHLHTLRHYYASYLLENNTSKQVTAELLGHGDTAFLERTYCHPQDSYKQKAANLFDEILRYKM